MKSYEDLVDHFSKHCAHTAFIQLRQRFCDKDEKIYHDIQLLKSEKKLVELLQANLAAVALDPNPKVRDILNQFKTGSITGSVLRGEISWDELYAHVDIQILDLEERYSRALRARQDLDAV